MRSGGSTGGPGTSPVEGNDRSSAYRPSLGIPAIASPKGGGAIRGLGEKFSANPAMGTASFTVPVAIPPGRSSLNPSFDLSYSTGTGNGPFGVGWQLSVSQISRKTDKGLPRYDDDSESDVFILSGAEDLVPALRPHTGGGDESDFYDFGDYRIVRYRPRVEGLFARIERWTRRTDGDIHWRITTKNNLTSVYGQSPLARIADPSDRARVFSWLLQETRDDRGNAVRYVYQAEDGLGVSASSLAEATRFAGDRPGPFVATAQRYLKRVLYGNRTPLATDQGSRFEPEEELDPRAWCFEIVLDYGDHSSTRPTPAADRDWSLRLDPFSTYRPTFEVRSYRLCRRILIFHRFPDLGSGPVLVGSTDFSFDETKLVSYLTKVERKGYFKLESGEYQPGNDGILPPITFDYSRPDLHRTPTTFSSESMLGLEAGVSGGYERWVDLNGEGIPGILWSTDRGWYYKENNGKADLSAPRRLTSLPSSSELGGELQLLDLGGDGQLDLAKFTSPMAGYWTRGGLDEWLPFASIRSVPHIDWSSPNLRFVDLDGDGLADVLITHDDALYWSQSRGKEGFDPALRVASDPRNDLRPRVVFADGTETLFLADMSGDGLVDIVRIRNSSICYWPSRGYGRFGDKITLEDAPQFDAPDQFDPRRIRLADIDGSGTTDILYLRSDAITIVFNQSGNSLSPAKFIDSLPPFSSALTVEVADVLGGGTACLVWSSPLPAQRGRPLMLIDLMGGKKPHLLTSIVNNFGGETLITYGTSTRAYLDDKAAGRRWITRLPFPVHVVTAVEHIDCIADTRLTTTYKYHHGYYDGQEREFRGFAFVEQRDAEEFDPKSKGSELKCCPVLTKTWFHTGVWLDRTSLEMALSHEFWTPEKRSSTLPKLIVPQGLTPGEEREATRALRGRKLREEIYWEDEDQSLRSLPYSVSQTGHEIRSIQRRGEQRHGVFFTYEAETLQYHYDRDPGDPRVAHQLTLTVDEFANVLQSAAIGYPRIWPLYDEQKRVWCKLAEAAYVNESRRDDWYRASIPIVTRQWELCGLPSDRFLTCDEVRNAAADAVEIPFEQTPDAALPQKRLIEAECIQYWRDNVGGPLPFGEIGRRAIVYQRYGLALTPGVIGDGLGDDRVTDDILANECHYVNGATAGISPLFPSLPPRSWWIPSGTLVPDPSRFYLPKEAVDAFGAKTRIDHDTSSIMVVRTTDARQNVTEADVNYRILNINSVTDSNGNVSLFSFNALGLVTSITLAGKNGEGDTRKNPTTEFRYELRRWVDGLAIPPNLLKHPAPVRVHVKSRVMHGSDNMRWEETYVYTDGSGREVMRKVLAEPGDVPMKGPDGKLIRNPDGSPQLHPVKIRWIGTGRTIYDNKGHPIKKYEPFFSDSFEYECEDEVVQWGVTPILHYDPIGRLVRTDNPDGTFSEVRFYSWRTEHWDENDTVLRSAWLREYQDGTPQQKRAARLASDHAESPAILHMDALGRPFLAVADNKERGSYETRSKLDIEGNVLSIHDAKGRLVSRNHYDIAGRQLQEWLADSGTRWRLPDAANKPVRQWDARDFVQRWVYDVLQRPTHLFVSNSSSRVASFGEAEQIAEPAQEAPAPRRPAASLWARTFGRTRPTSIPHIQSGVRRPSEPGSSVSVLIAPSPGDELLVERRYYGEDVSDDQSSRRLNLRTRLALIFDGAGVLRNDSFDFKGNLTRSTRLLAREYRLDPDWATLGPVEHAEDAQTAAKTLLDPVEFTTETVYDALNRTIRRVSPDKSVTHFGYNERGLVAKIDVQIRGVGARTEFVRSVAYNERNQRCRIEYGNTVLTTYQYDERTFRLVELSSTRTRKGRTEKLQRSIYTYDSVGNILSIQDKSDAAIFFTGKVLLGDGAYEYDAVYQLVRASGREHPSAAPTQDDTPTFDIPHPNDNQALQRYDESYEYDEVGNIRTISHRVDGSVLWTRSYAYVPDSNRLATTLTSGSPTIRYRHDETGNIDQMPHLKSMRWDFANRLRYADLGGGGKVWFTYDSNGQRVRKRYIHNGIVEQRIYRDEFEVYDRSASGTRTGGGSGEISRETLHVTDGGKCVAMVETKTREALLVAMSRSQTRQRYQLANHLGSSVVEVDDKAEVISFEEYHAFGSTSFHSARSGVEVSAKRYRYIGKERDDETGLYYHGARYYAAYLGRWISCEPAISRSLAGPFSEPTTKAIAPNAYAAVNNNPIHLVDADGLNPISDEQNRSDFGLFSRPTTSIGPSSKQFSLGLDLDLGRPALDLRPVDHRSDADDVRNWVTPVHISPNFSSFGELGPLLENAVSNLLNTKHGFFDTTAQQPVWFGPDRTPPPTVTRDIFAPQQKTFFHDYLANHPDLTGALLIGAVGAVPFVNIPLKHDQSLSFSVGDSAKIKLDLGVDFGALNKGELQLHAPTVTQAGAELRINEGRSISGAASISFDGLKKELSAGAEISKGPFTLQFTGTNLRTEQQDLTTKLLFRYDF